MNMQDKNQLKRGFPWLFFGLTYAMSWLIWGAVAPAVDHDRCTLCGLCAESCPYDAIATIARTGKITIDAEKCFGCGLCITRCRPRALSLAM
jgi:ferredoxin